MNIAILNGEEVINIIVVDNTDDEELMNTFVQMNSGTSYVEADSNAQIGGKWNESDGFIPAEVNNV